MSNTNKYNEDRPIWLTSLAEADREAAPPKSIEDKLQGALRHRRRGLIGQRAGAAVIVAGLAFGVWQISTVKSISSIEVVDEEVADAITEAMNISGDEDAEFVPTKLALEQPLESIRVVRVSMPGASLVNYGLASDDGATGGEVTADLLVGQDGIPRAIRVVK